MAEDGIESREVSGRYMECNGMRLVVFVPLNGVDSMQRDDKLLHD
jgi:hypothetical protein